MLREVIRLCKGDFTEVVKRFEVYQLEMAGKTRVMVFANKDEAQKYVDMANDAASKKGVAVIFEIKEIQYQIIGRV